MAAAGRKTDIMVPLCAAHLYVNDQGKKIAHERPGAIVPGMSLTFAEVQSRITELERALEAIRRKDRLITESQNVVNRILGSLPVVIYVYDLAEKRNAYISREAGDFLGYTSEEIQAMGSDMLARLMHPEDLGGAIAHHARLAKAEAGAVLQYRYRVKNSKGQWRWFVSSDTPFEKEPGADTRFILGCLQEVFDLPVD